MTLDEYKKQFSEDDAVGWIEIDQEFDRLYPNQEPKHYVPPIPYMLGGEDPLDGISIYESKKQTDHLHFVTYGFSELYYNEDKLEDEFSKWGFELTFRLKPFEPDNGNPSWYRNAPKHCPICFRQRQLVRRVSLHAGKCTNSTRYRHGNHCFNNCC